MRTQLRILAAQVFFGATLGIIAFVTFWSLGMEMKVATGWGLVIFLLAGLTGRSLVRAAMLPRLLADSAGESQLAVPTHSEYVLLLRWCLGFFLVVVPGWGLFALSLFLTRRTPDSKELVLSLLTSAHLVYYLFMERNFQLSHLLNLRISPYMTWWMSAMTFWFFGLLAIIARSTNPDKVLAKHDPGSKLRPSDAGGREVVETVVFVVVLVLLLKSFAAEAFVIPTGSMAETLYGNQKIVKCPQCTHKFPVNCSDEVDPTEGFRVRVEECKCPNCRLEIRLVDPERKVTPKPNEVPDPGPSSGDRVLVAKFLYDTGMPGARKPERLDVVVFKFPGHSDRMRDLDSPLVEGPQKNHVAMNYIKRLIGLPGETIGIRGGDLYTLPPDKSPTYNDAAGARPLDLWHERYMHENDSATKDLWQRDPKSFQIIRKSPRVLQSMMRIVYDNDQQAQDLSGKKEYQRWRVEGEGWETLDESKAFRRDPKVGEESWLRYYHVLRGDGGEPSLITDFMGYNSGKPRPRGSDNNGTNWVGDLILECDLVIEKAEGEFTMELVRCGERFRAVITLGDGGSNCTFYRLIEGDKAIRVGESRPVKLGKGTHQLRFANVDHRLTLWVDNELPFDEGEPYEALPDRGPTALDKQPVGIGVKGMATTIRSIKLYRDSYHAVSTDPDVLIHDWKDSREWDRLKSPPSKTLYVQPGHYLCLGDNSLQSSDGRTWGLVPQRLMLGRALLVYFPFGRAGRIR